MQIWQNLNEHYYYLISKTRKLFYIPVVDYASFSHQALFHICFFVLFSHVFTALEFDSNHVGLLL